MLIGLTYDLRNDYLAEGFGEEETAEFDRPDTIESIERELQALGHRTDRVGHVRALTARLAQGDRWDLVWNIAEGLHGYGRESQVPCLLDAFSIPYTFSDPLACALTLHKGVTKRVVRDAGLPTPDFEVVDGEADLRRCSRLPLPLFAKPVAEGTSKGVTAISKITSHAQLGDVCRRLLAEFRQPVLVETFLPGREVTVGIVGTGDRARTVAVMEVVLLPGADAEVYTYENKERCEERCRYSLADGDFAAEASALALEVWRVIGGRDGGRVDLRADAAGRLSFMEVNPLPGLHPEHSDLPIMCSLAGISYRDLIGWILNSALERVPAAGRNDARPGATPAGSAAR